MGEIYIVSGVRTPIGKVLGFLSSFSATDLGAIVIKEAVKRANVPPDKIEEVIMGRVLPAGQGQSPARIAAIKAGLSPQIPAYTINKVCGSGLKAVMLAIQAIKAGDIDIAVAGGMESMTNAPHLIYLRGGTKYGDTKAVDHMVYDGLWCFFNNLHMGNLAEYTAKKAGIKREEQDKFAYESHMKAVKATKEGKFKKEILPLYLSGEVDLDKRGNIVKFRGDPPFVEFWDDISAQEVGFFGIVFPEHKVSVDESWKESITLKRIGEVRLGEKGVECNLKFIRLMDEVTDEKRLAVFEVSSPFIYKDLIGFIDQMGSTLKLNISKLERIAKGKIKFDQEKGLLTVNIMKSKANALMYSPMEKQNLDIKLMLNADMVLRLISVDSKSFNKVE